MVSAVPRSRGAVTVDLDDCIDRDLENVAAGGGRDRVLGLGTNCGRGLDRDRVLGRGRGTDCDRSVGVRTPSSVLLSP